VAGAQRGRAHDVGEQDRDQLSLLGHRASLLTHVPLPWIASRLTRVRDGAGPEVLERLFP
jgi:hypothetical protein